MKILQKLHSHENSFILICAIVLSIFGTSIINASNTDRIITDIKTTDIAHTSSQINFETSVPTMSFIMYWEDGLQDSLLHTVPSKDYKNLHSKTLSNLKENTEYNIAVVVRNVEKEIYFEKTTLTTLESTNTPLSNQTNSFITSLEDKEFTPFHELDNCYDVSTIEIESLRSLYPNGDNELALNTIYVDTSSNTFYSDLTLQNAPSNAQLEEIDNRCVYIYGERLEKNQTINFQLGLEIASTNDAYFYLERNVYLDKTVSIKSNTTLIGVDNNDNKAQISPYLNDVQYLIRVHEGAQDIELRNLNIREVREIDQGFVLFQGKNEDIRIRSVDFIGENVDPSKRTRGLFFTGEFQKNVLIRDSNFSNIEYSIQFFSPVEGLQVLQNTFTKWSHYALLTNISTQVEDGQSKNIEIRHNEFKHAAAGGDRGVILISPGKSVRYVTNVEITSNTFVGNGGSWVPPSKDPDYANNDAHSDQIVIHKTNNFIISNNDVSQGGENGITTSRLSRNGIVSNNKVYDNDGNGISVGSGYFELHLSDTDGLELGDRIKGTETNSEGTITYIYPNYNIVGIEKINASSKVITSPTFGNEIITIDKGDTILEKTITVVDRTKKIDLLDNEFFSNGHNRAKEHADGIFSGIYVINSDSINFRRNHFYNGADTLVQKWAITGSRSRNLLRDGSNTYENRELRRSDIQIQALTSINQ